MAKRAAILTLVGNTEGGSGPGHSAIQIDDTVYSFENAGDWFSWPWKEKSGWIVIKSTKYADKNSWRPIIVQEMNPALVCATAALKYVKSSIVADDDYLSSGVCSSQVANAIDKGTTKSFNPSGIDTPYKVFHLAQKRGLPSATYLLWPEPKKNGAQEKLDTDYRTVQACGAGILSWT